jgi:hypothetical protein
MNSSFRLVFSRPLVAGVSSLFLLAGLCSANTVFSEMGALSTPEDTVLINLTLTTTGDVTLQTYGFGGGTNAATTVIPSGGFDAFVGLFSGTGPTALFINGTSDILSNYSPGCPPAGTLTIGSVPAQCGDVNLQFTGLAAGTYTVLLSDGAYVPNAVFEASPAYLGDGFSDLTGGVFQTCYDASDCNNDTANWALDITAPDGSTIPEPAPLGMVAMGLAFAAGLGRAQFGKTLKPRSQR